MMRREDLTSETEEETMMPFSGTCVVPGALWLHGFIIQESDPILIGCLMHSIKRWLDSGASVGGQSSRGHGRLKVAFHFDPDCDIESAVQSYEQHVREKAEDCQQWFEDRYGIA